MYFLYLSWSLFGYGYAKKFFGGPKKDEKVVKDTGKKPMERINEETENVDAIGDGLDKKGAVDHDMNESVEELVDTELVDKKDI